MLNGQGLQQQKKRIAPKSVLSAKEILKNF